MKRNVFLSSAARTEPSGTEAARACNGNVFTVAKLMGHASIATTQRYVGWTPAGAETVAAMFT